ncbi:UNVERIFIED_CONTAM: Pumilio5 [Sesamum latifolium]|uniref:Pumilio5 n=1 Tax=Sesamum latifolium TaxID=2727402 RepID=A0AAW2U3G0_9LAMI
MPLVLSLDGMRGTVAGPPAHRRDFNAVRVDMQDNLSTSVAGDVDNAHIETVESVNSFSFSNLDSHKFQKKGQLNRQNNVLQQQAATQERNTSQVQGSYSQIIYPGTGNAYGSLNQFPYGSASVTTAESISSQSAYSCLINSITAWVATISTLRFCHRIWLDIRIKGPFLLLYSASFPISGVPNGGSVHAYDLQNLLKFYGQVGVPMQPPFHMQYFQYSHLAHQTPRNGAAVNQLNSYDSKRQAELVGLSNDYKSQYPVGYDNPNLKRGNMSSHNSLTRPTNAGPLSQIPGASVVSPALQSKPAAGTKFHGGKYNLNLSHPSSGNSSKANGQSWSDMSIYSFLEELKSGKGQRCELSDIAGHLVELRHVFANPVFCFLKAEITYGTNELFCDLHFSVDQHGSRFIQQKLETCSVEEKASALEVIDLEQKSRLVRELDGHVMRCVRDQNGNHVIQKCIESIPTQNIQFIISSFRGKLPRSQHILMVARHTETQFIVDEILDSVCSLAQDQYGNYVTQHVLMRGKPRERSEIIEKLAGSIVQLSQHKFASNVVEKCLEYSDSTAREMLIKEIIGYGDKNDNVLIMMKDQYANYVVQKILEKCSSDQREVLLGLIRNNLTAFKEIYVWETHCRSL